MSLKARSVYRELLDAQWGEDDCGLPNDDSTLAALAGCSLDEWLEVRAQVMAWFDEFPDGKIRNPRCLYEWRLARKKRSAKRRAARDANKARWDKGKQKLRTESETDADGVSKVSPPTPAPSPTPAPIEKQIPAWSTEACDDWIAGQGGTAPGGKIGRAIKPLVDKHTWPVVRRGWKAFCSSKDARFGAAYFAEHYGQYAVSAEPFVSSVPLYVDPELEAKRRAAEGKAS